MSSFVLLILGLLLILIEFFLPGAVFGVLGGISLVASMVIFVMEGHSPIALLFYIAAIVVLLGYLIKFALWRIRKTRPQQSMYADASQDGYFASSYDKSAIGKQGIVLSDLKPGGYILIDDKKYQALSVSGYIAKDRLVDVIGGQEESLLVRGSENTLNQS